jgi:hypothetical protein
VNIRIQPYTTHSRGSKCSILPEQTPPTCDPTTATGISISFKCVQTTCLRSSKASPHVAAAALIQKILLIPLAPTSYSDLQQYNQLLMPQNWRQIHTMRHGVKPLSFSMLRIIFAALICNTISVSTSVAFNCKISASPQLPHQWHPRLPLA